MTFPSPDAPGRFGLTPAKAVVVAMALVVLVVVAVLVVVFVLGPGRGGGQQGAAPSAPSTAQASGAASGDQPCPKNEGSQDQQVTQAPAATWQYQGRTAYPVSQTYGPAASGDSGRFCFQHSATGALFMAANAAVEGTSAPKEEYAEWFKRAAANGPYRSSFRAGSTSGLDYTDVRISIEGFKVLSYTGDAATIDLGIAGLKDGQQIYASAVYYLVWQDGDWKLSADVANPMLVNITPDLAGYIPWTA